MRTRLALGGAGVLMGLVGLGWILTMLGTRIPALVLWLALPLAVHDGMIVPATLAGAWVFRRVVPRDWWGPAVVLLVATAPLVLVGLTDLLSPARTSIPGVPGLLDRPYATGLAWAVGVTWLLILVATAPPTRHLLRRRRNHTDQT